jgi:mRNA interferase RelE/StbE
VAAFRVVLTPAAQRQLDRLRGAPFVGLRGLILSLADDPRPAGSAKLSGRRDLWRVRVRIDGRSWRIVYQLLDHERLVVVTRVARRDEGTYRGL